MFSRSNWILSSLLGSILVGCVLYAVAQDKENTEDEIESTEVECFVTVQCRDNTDLVMYEEELMGTGFSEFEARLDAYNQCADFDCGLFGEDLTMHCCESGSSTSNPPCVEPYCPTKKDKDEDTSPETRYTYSAVGKSSKKRFTVAGLDDARTYERFLKIAEKHGGFDPGTFESDEADRLYVCYVRLRWEHQTLIPENNSIEDIEVEGKGVNKGKATSQAVKARNNLVALLQKDPLTISVNPIGAPHCTRAHDRGGVSVKQKITCETVTQDKFKYVVAIRHAHTKLKAQAAATAAAALLADPYDGIKEDSCVYSDEDGNQLPPVQQQSSVGCCGSRVAAAK